MARKQSFRADFSEWRQYERKLERIRHKAIPFAVRASLDATAFDAQRGSREFVRSKMTLRNKWTGRSIRVNKVGRELNIDRMRSETGSSEDYMRMQEEGGIVRSNGKHGVAIPTSFASGEGLKSKPKKRLPRRANKLSQIKLGRGKTKFKSKRQEAFLKVKEAVESGHRFVFLDNGRNKAIYRVSGSGRVNKKGKFSGVKMRMVWNLENKTVKINKTNWLTQEVDDALKGMPQNYKRALLFQLKRIK